MGGNSVDDDWELASSSNEVRTVVLVGRSGNGKSATGNTILGKKLFNSDIASSGVTSFCEMHTTMLNDGHIINVIDTPVRTRFTKEELAALHSLQTLFGSKIVDYMIVVFTGGDDLEFSDQRLEDYVGSKCSEPLKEVLTLCKNRCVLFNNRALDEKKKYEQVQQLLSLVNMVISQNGGQPYTNEYFTELKKNQQREDESLKGLSKGEISEMKIQLQLAHEEQLRKTFEMAVVDLREANKRLEKQLEEEKTARLEAEENSKKQLKEEKIVRLEAEKNAKKQLAEKKDARMKAKKNAKKQLAEEKTARVEAEENSKKQLAEETSRLEAEENAKNTQTKSEDVIVMLEEVKGLNEENVVQLRPKRNRIKPK